MSAQWQWLLEVGAFFWGRSKSKRHKNILIVEDDAEDAELLTICLARHAMKGTVTHTAEGALALIERNSISIAFIDMRLTFMPGWELIPLIRARSPDTLIVVLCGDIRDLEKIKKDVWPIVVMAKPPSVDGIERLIAHLKT